MSLPFAIGGDGRGRKTEAANTAIVTTCTGKTNYYTNLVKVSVTTQGTAHVLTVMRDASSTTLSADAAASQAVVNVTAALTDGAGNAIAAGDYVSLKLANGNWFTTTFSSASGLAYTLAASLPSAASDNAPIYCYGVVGDAFHDDYDFTLTASVTNTYPNADTAVPVVRGRSRGAPLILYIDNATAASTLLYQSWEWTRE